MNITFAYDSINNCSDISVDGICYQELDDQLMVDELSYIEDTIIDMSEDMQGQLKQDVALEQVKQSAIFRLERSFPTATVRFEEY